MTRPNRVEYSPKHKHTPDLGWADAFRAWLRIAAMSFGGPAGQISVMHQILVEEKRWISERTFQQALSFCMLLPGPEAHQLVTYTGWMLRGWRGGLCAGCLFILPGTLALLGLSWMYVNHQTAPAMGAGLYGIRAATVALVAGAVLRLARRTLRTRLAAVWAVLAFGLLASGRVPFPIILLVTGLGGVWEAKSREWGQNSSLQQSTPPASPAHPAHHPAESQTIGLDVTESSAADNVAPQPDIHPSPWTTLQTAVLWLIIWWFPVLLVSAVLGKDSIVVAEGLFFSEVSVCTLGGAYAILPYVARQAVEEHGWLTPGEMVDGLGMAESTPGPLVIVLQFVGFLAAWKNPGDMAPISAALIGSFISSWVTFAPSFLFVFTFGPWFRRLSRQTSWAGALAGTSAATVGVMAHLLVWLIMTVWLRPAATASQFSWLPPQVDWTAFAISLVACIALVRFQIGIGWVITGAAVTGWAVTLNR